ncbi:unnamed protein product [Pleuronectes platessa]|uniref:Uncharacterized protein n=1 Tax=Pleuronectes platessa TaxID=8262 RepID=A0A9N7UAN6_PLEPL|nr:unnamed protein product [Pleuronectes platessa]
MRAHILRRTELRTSYHEEERGSKMKGWRWDHIRYPCVNPSRKQNQSRWVSEYGHGGLTGICLSTRRRWMHKKRRTNLNNNNLTTVPPSSLVHGKRGVSLTYMLRL